MSNSALKQENEREHVRRLLVALGRPAIRLDSLHPPAPDVRVTFNGSIEVFEVTEIHPDERPGKGSAARGAEELRASRDPQGLYLSWIHTNAIPAIRYRFERKERKALKYEVQPGESLSLLLVGSIPRIGAVASTLVIEAFQTTERLNTELNELLLKSRFQCAYLHLPLSGNALWGWDRQSGWHVRRSPDDLSAPGRQMLGALRSLGGFSPDGLLPGTQVFGPRRT